MQFLENDIKEYVEFAWSTFDFQICSSSEASHEINENSVTANVQISGTWRGTITFITEYDLVQQLAQRMFSREKEKATVEEVNDAAAEMINIIGGNLKSLFPQPSYLSLPIVDLKGTALHFPFMEQVSKVAFDCMGKKFMVVVHQALEQKAPNRPSKVETSSFS